MSQEAKPTLMRATITAEYMAYRTDYDSSDPVQMAKEDMVLPPGEIIANASSVTMEIECCREH